VIYPCFKLAGLEFRSRLEHTVAVAEFGGHAVGDLDVGVPEFPRSASWVAHVGGFGAAEYRSAGLVMDDFKRRREAVPVRSDPCMTSRDSRERESKLPGFGINGHDSIPGVFCVEFDESVRPGPKFACGAGACILAGTCQARKRGAQ